jgi:transposase
VADAAEAFGVSERTAYRWLARWDAGKPMTDLSSAPHTIANRTDDTIEALIEQLRRCRWTSTRIATELRMPTSTVCAVLKRIGLNGSAARSVDIPCVAQGATEGCSPCRRSSRPSSSVMSSPSPAAVT